MGVKKPARGRLLFSLGADPSAEISVDGAFRNASRKRKARRWAGLCSGAGSTLMVRSCPACWMSTLRARRRGKRNYGTERPGQPPTQPSPAQSFPPSLHSYTDAKHPSPVAIIDLVQRHQLKHGHQHTECNKAAREDPARLFVRLEISKTTE